MTVPFGPVPVPSRDGSNIAYELEVVTADGKKPVPEKIEVLDPVSGKALFLRFYNIRHPILCQLSGNSRMVREKLLCPGSLSGSRSARTRFPTVSFTGSR